jgi:sugar phosphate isomerase/epimerase
MSWTRRSFLASVAGAAVAPAHMAAAAGFPGTVCLFSKHLPALDAPALGRAVKSLGLGAVDLTVRPGGHVPPERAAGGLAPFVRALRAEGVEVPMITTALVSASDPHARAILETAGRERVRFFKTGYFRYRFADVRAEIEEVGVALRGLAALAAECGVPLGFHNHAGYIGGPVWDIVPVMETLDPRAAGYYFDVRHAVAEGGDAGWKSALLQAAPRLKMVAVKDFFWERTPAGWRQRNCPLGQGMVDWKAFFATLAGVGFQGPVSLHLEYEIPGATPAAQQENTLAAAARDLAFLKSGLAAAYGGAAS